jgi:hypothetical protein
MSALHILGEYIVPIDENTMGGWRAVAVPDVPLIVAGELRRLVYELQTERERMLNMGGQTSRAVGLGDAVIALRARIVELTEGGES